LSKKCGQREASPDVETLEASGITSDFSKSNPRRDYFSATKDLFPHIGP
jgi:hypothetical protein